MNKEAIHGEVHRNLNRSFVSSDGNGALPFFERGRFPCPDHQETPRRSGGTINHDAIDQSASLKGDFDSSQMTLVA